MSNLYVRELDPRTHLQQFDANCGKIQYVSDSKFRRKLENEIIQDKKSELK